MALPHVRPPARQVAPLRLQQPVPAVHAVAGRAHEPDRRQGLPQGDGPGDASLAWSEGRRLRPDPEHPGGIEGSHALHRHPPRRDPGHLRPDPRRSRGRHLRRGERPALSLRTGRQLRRARPHGRASFLRLLGQPCGAARAGHRRDAGGLAGLPEVHAGPRRRQGGAAGTIGAGHHREGARRARRADRDADRPAPGATEWTRATRPTRGSGRARGGQQQQRDGAWVPAVGSSLGAGHADRPRRFRGRSRLRGMGDLARRRTSPG